MYSYGLIIKHNYNFNVMSCQLKLNYSVNVAYNTKILWLCAINNLLVFTVT